MNATTWGPELDGEARQKQSRGGVMSEHRFFVRSQVRGFVRDCYVTVESTKGRGSAELILKHELTAAGRLFDRLGVEASFRLEEGPS